MSLIIDSTQLRPFAVINKKPNTCVEVLAQCTTRANAELKARDLQLNNPNEQYAVVQMVLLSTCEPET